MSYLGKKVNPEIVKNGFLMLREKVSENRPLKNWVDQWVRKAQSLELREELSKQKSGKLANIAEGLSIQTDNFVSESVDLLNQFVANSGVWIWEKNIKSFSEKTSKFLKEAQVWFWIENIKNKLEKSPETRFYTEAIKWLDILSKSEQPLIDMQDDIDAHQWIPDIKSLKTECFKMLEKANPKSGLVKSENVWAKVTENSGALQFVIGGLLLEFDGVVLKYVRPANKPELMESMVVEKSSWKTGSGKYYFGNKWEFEVKQDGTRLLNGQFLIEADTQKALLSRGVLDMRNASAISEISLFENIAKSVKRIDFATRFTHRLYENVEVIVFKRPNASWIQIIQDGKSKFEKATGKEIVEKIRTLLGTDVSEMFEQELKNNKHISEQIYIKINEIENDINFINGLIEKTQNSDSDDETKRLLISEMETQKSVLESDIHDLRNELNKLV